jgi:hypothetical protein
LCRFLYASVLRHNDRWAKERSAWHALVSLHYAAAFTFTFALAVLSKETGVTLVPVLVVYDVLDRLSRKPSDRRLSDWLLVALRVALLCTLSGLYILTRVVLMKSEASTGYSFADMSLDNSGTVVRSAFADSTDE